MEQLTTLTGITLSICVYVCRLLNNIMVYVNVKWKLNIKEVVGEIQTENLTKLFTVLFIKVQNENEKGLSKTKTRIGTLGSAKLQLFKEFSKN